jgi:23S rRNA pseudouridine1911/1915/1917 synthase
MDDDQEIVVSVDATDAGVRLDKWLTDHVADMSRNRVQALIADGRLSGPVGIVDDISKKVRAGETYTLTIPPPAPARPEPEDIPLDILYEDEHLIVLVKPAGLVVHPAPGHATGTLVHALLHHCRGSLSGIGGVTRPGIVHRLDKDTSGVMVSAKSDVAHRHLVEQFQVHSIERAYMAVVWGLPSPRSGRIESRIGRDPHNRKRMASVRSGGKEAITDYRVIRPVGALAALVDCHLFTGRTHQIRVHMLSLGHPLVGDPLYQTRGSLRKQQSLVSQERLGKHKNQALHAYKLGFVHPVTAQKMSFEIELSLEMNALLDSLDQL